METRKGDTPLRWVVLSIAIINIVFNSLLDKFTDVPSIKDLTYQYKTLFVPASYAFAIWGLIYLAYLIYCVIQLLPSQKYKAGYDYINIPFMIVNVLGIVWVYAYRQGLVAFSEAVIIAMLICSMVLFSISQRLVRRLNYSRWITVPFSMLMGWLSVATIAATAVFLVNIKWDAMNINAANWVLIVLALVLGLTLFIGIGFKDFVFPLVIGWATFALWISLKDTETLAAQVALGVAVVSLLIAVWAMISQFKTRQMTNTQEQSF